MAARASVDRRVGRVANGGATGRRESGAECLTVRCVWVVSKVPVQPILHGQYPAGTTCVDSARTAPVTLSLHPPIVGARDLPGQSRLRIRPFWRPHVDFQSSAAVNFLANIDRNVLLAFSADDKSALLDCGSNAHALKAARVDAPL